MFYSIKINACHEIKSERGRERGDVKKREGKSRVFQVIFLWGYQKIIIGMGGGEKM